MLMIFLFFVRPSASFKRSVGLSYNLYTLLTLSTAIADGLFLSLISYVSISQNVTVQPSASCCGHQTVWQPDASRLLCCFTAFAASALQHIRKVNLEPSEYQRADTEKHNCHNPEVRSRVKILPEPFFCEHRVAISVYNIKHRIDFEYFL